MRWLRTAPRQPPAGGEYRDDGQRAGTDLQVNSEEIICCYSCYHNELSLFLIRNRFLKMCMSRRDGELTVSGDCSLIDLEYEYATHISFFLVINRQ